MRGHVEYSGRRPALSYPWPHGTAHYARAQLFAFAFGRQAFFWGYVSVFPKFCIILRVPRFLAGFAVLGFGDAGPWVSLACQSAAAELHPDCGDYRLAHQSRDPLTARRGKTGVCEALG